MIRSVVTLLLVGSLTAWADTKIIKNDTFTGAGAINAAVSFGEYEGAAVLFEPDPADYPLKIIAIDILAVAYNNQGTGFGAYELDIWDESAGTVAPPFPSDGGTSYIGRVSRQGVGVTTSSTMFNRFTLAQPLIVPSGKVFVKFSEQTQTSLSGTTIALDNAASPKPGANWYFDGAGYFYPFDQSDGGFYNGLRSNWILRLVLEVPDQGVTVTAISPNSSVVGATTNVVITGTNFQLGAKAFLGTNELPITNLTGTGIAATVSGLTAGRYDVKVRNLSGIEGVLPNGYTVLSQDGGMPMGGGAGGGTGGGSATGGGATGGGSGGGTGNEALALTAITPTQTYQEDATALFLTGAGFKAGARVLVGGTVVEGAIVESGGVISAALTSNLLTPGKYDVSVINLNGEQATLPQAFTVLAGSKAAPKGCSCTQLEGAVALLALAALARRRNHGGR